MSYRDSRRPSNDNDRDRFAGFRVYVGDIGQRMNRSDLEREFGQYGPVTDVWMGRRREPQQQNYAFVVYRYPEDAEEAVRDRNGRKVLGRKVRVEHAKPLNSNPRRQRGGWNGDGGGGGGGRGGNRGNYYSQRRDMPQRRSRERNYNRRSSSQSPARNARYQESPNMNRGRNESYSNSPPKKIIKRSRSSSESPERKSQKPKKSKRQVSPSPSPPPVSRSNQHLQDDSDSGSLSPSPPPQKKKKKKKQRTKSPESSQVSREYDARQYQKQQDKYREAGKAKSAKSKKKDAYLENDYSSDDN